MTATVGELAPDFSLMDQHKNVVTRDSLMGKPSLIVFIPFPFTGICEGELCDLRDNMAQLNSMDGNVVVVTCHAVPTNKAWGEANDYEFGILADYWPHGEVAKAYGCFNDALGVAMRATYVLDAEGVVREIIATDSLGEARTIASYQDSLAAL